MFSGIADFFNPNEASKENEKEKSLTNQSSTPDRVSGQLGEVRTPQRKMVSGKRSPDGGRAGHQRKHDGGRGNGQQLTKGGGLNAYAESLPRSREPSLSASPPPKKGSFTPPPMPDQDKLRRDVAIAEEFKARMKAGVDVLKLKSNGRVVKGEIAFINDYKWIQWTNKEGRKILGIRVGSSNKRKVFALAHIAEINTGEQPDPDDTSQCGSAPIRTALAGRKLAAPGMACALKFEDGFTLDLAFAKAETCSRFVEQLRIQVFKVKLTNFQNDLEQSAKGSSAARNV